MLTACAMLSCAHTPRVVIPQNKPAKLEKIDCVTRQAQVIYIDSADGIVKKGWMPIEELSGRTFILEDGWLNRESK